VDEYFAVSKNARVPCIFEYDHSIGQEIEIRFANDCDSQNVEICPILCLHSTGYEYDRTANKSDFIRIRYLTCRYVYRCENSGESEDERTHISPPCIYLIVARRLFFDDHSSGLLCCSMLIKSTDISDIPL
jgi:hypothetical protein